MGYKHALSKAWRFVVYSDQENEREAQQHPTVLTSLEYRWGRPVETGMALGEFNPSLKGSF